MKARFRNKLESFVRCEEQLWPDCGGPSNTFLPPHAVQGGKATQTYSLGLGRFAVGSKFSRFRGGQMRGSGD